MKGKNYFPIGLLDIAFEILVALKRAVWFFLRRQFTACFSFRISLEEEQLECWGEHLLEQ